MPHKNDEVSSSSHTRWDCEYHIVLMPKYRRKVIFTNDSKIRGLKLDLPVISLIGQIEKPLLEDVIYLSGRKRCDNWIREIRAVF